MDQRENREEQFQAVIDKTENIRPRKKREKKEGLKYELLDLMRIFVICFIRILLLTNFVVRPVRADGRSMNPTLEDGEIGLMNVFSVESQDIKRFDVVVVYDGEKKENQVRHVIGLPGDTIYAEDDVVYINSMPIEEPYFDNAYVNQIHRCGDNFTEDFPKRTLKDNEYFPMRGNRVVPYDSRRVGPFKREDIRGRNVYVLFLFNKIKAVRNGGTE